MIFLPVIMYIPPTTIFWDTYEADRSWERIAAAGSVWYLQGGEFFGRHTAADRNTSVLAPVQSYAIPQPYYVEVDLILAGGSSSNGSGGIIFDFLSSASQSTYRFSIRPAAASGDNWFVQVRKPGYWQTLASGRDETHIYLGYSINRLRLERGGSQIAAYANNHLIWQGADSTFEFGRVGLNVGTPADLLSGEFVEFIFDNFNIGFL